MNTTGLRNLSSIFDRLKAADPKANSQPNAALDRLDAAVALMAPAPEPPSGYTIDDMEEAEEETAEAAVPAVADIQPAAPMESLREAPPEPEFVRDEAERREEFHQRSEQLINELRPPVPETIEHTGLSSKLIEQLIVKLIYYRGGMVGRQLSEELGLQFSVIDSILDQLKRNHHVIVKSALGVEWFLRVLSYPTVAG